MIGNENKYGDGDGDSDGDGTTALIDPIICEKPECVQIQKYGCGSFGAISIIHRQENIYQNKPSTSNGQQVEMA